MSVQFEIPKEYEVLQSPENLPPIFNGEKLVMYAILKCKKAKPKKISNCTVTLKGNMLGAQQEHKMRFVLDGSAPVLPVIHHLAAKALITDWGSEYKHKKGCIELSIESNVISSYTAFIAVDEESSEPVSGAMKTYDILPSDIPYMGSSIKPLLGGLGVDLQYSGAGYGSSTMSLGVPLQYGGGYAPQQGIPLQYGAGYAPQQGIPLQYGAGYAPQQGIPLQYGAGYARQQPAMGSMQCMAHYPTPHNVPLQYGAHQEREPVEKWQVPMQSAPHGVPLQYGAHQQTVPMQSTPHGVPLQYGAHQQTVPMQSTPHGVPLQYGAHQQTVPMQSTPHGVPLQYGAHQQTVPMQSTPHGVPLQYGAHQQTEPVEKGAGYATPQGVPLEYEAGYNTPMAADPVFAKKCITFQSALPKSTGQGIMMRLSQSAPSRRSRSRSRSRSPPPGRMPPLCSMPPPPPVAGSFGQPPASKPTDTLTGLISAQQVDGSWALNSSFAQLIRRSLPDVESACPTGVGATVWATVLAVSFLKVRYSSQQDEWELIVMKAESWLKKQSFPSGCTLEQLFQTAAQQHFQ